MWVKDGGISALLRRHRQPGDEVEGRRRRQRLSSPLRLHRALSLQQRAGLQRPHARLEGAARLVRARRPPRLRADGGGGKRTLVDNYQGKRLNSPNDLCFKSNGDLYFTDPPYGLPKLADDPMRELDFCGVYRLSPDGKLTLLTKDMTRPNGLAFSPDEKTLYVAQSDPKAAVWMAFPVLDDGTLGPGKVFADVTENAGKMPGPSRRNEGRREGKPVRHRSRRLPRLFAARKTPGPHRNGRKDRQLRLGRTTAACSTCVPTCISAGSKRRPKGPAGRGPSN